MSRDYDLDTEYEDIDIDATVEALRAAWKCVPDATLSELLDIVTPMPFVEMKNDEIIESLNEFIHQNSK
jgi:hypothetical protein